MHVTIRQGLDVPVPGRPEPLVREGGAVRRLALLGSDCAGARPALRVAAGERVRLGQELFVDRRRPRIRFTAPGAGVVEAVNLGPRRRLESVVIALDDSGAEEQFEVAGAPAGPGRDALVELLLRSGLWTALRSRPFERIPDPDAEPCALFVTAIDTRPLAAPAELAVAERAEDHARGLLALTALTAGRVFVCHAAGADPRCPDHPRLLPVALSGPHPAGLPGTHVHRLAPVDERRSAWHLGAQEVIALGRLLASGRLDTTRLVALGGPLVEHPRVVRAPIGADLGELLGEDWTDESPSLLISGSPLDGRLARETTRFLGRRDLQACLLPAPGEARRSLRSGLIPTTAFEEVFPFGLPVVPLLRALLAGDDERARELGCLELAEEDLALLAHLCPSGLDHAAALRGVLDRLERLCHER